MKWFKRRNKPEYPYESFFFDFSSLGDQPAPKSVNLRYPEGTLRQEAYKYLMSRHPDDVRYVLHYCQTDAYVGIYDDEQFEHCFRYLDQGLTLPDKANCHDKLRKLRRRLEALQVELAEIAEDTAVEDRNHHSELTQLRREKNYADILDRFDKVRDHQPIGIHGGDDERRFWGLFQLAIDTYFEQKKPEEGLALMTEYERRRIQVKLNPIPDFTVQPKVIGYLAQTSVSRARKRLQYWLENSKVQCICDTIKHHSEFRAMFPDADFVNGAYS